MKITLCGSARFEKEFKEINRRLTLAGHVVYSLAVYPSDMGEKVWYTPGEKKILDEVHKKKIDASDAIYVISPGGYIGESTKSEIDYALKTGKQVISAYPHSRFRLTYRSCPYPGCSDPLNVGPCALCYE